MRTLFSLSLLLAFILMTGCAEPPITPEILAPVYNATAEGDGIDLRVTTEDKSLLIDVYSTSGIGKANVARVSGEPPEKIVLRLHLTGLEEFRFSYDQTTITVSVSSQDSRAIAQSLASPEGGERPIDPDNPFWLDITIVSDQATPEIPLAQGYFEITLPESLLTEAGTAFSIQWIDFYR